MFYTLLVVLATFSLVTSAPIYILKPESDSSMDEIIYVPYDVDYVPVKVPIPAAETSLDEETFLKLKDLNHLPKTTLKLDFNKAQEPMKNEADSSKGSSHESTTDKSISFDLFEDKFNADQSKSSEDFVLVPISVFKELQDGSIGDSSDRTPIVASNLESSDKTHKVAKRQAPGNDFRIYRPVVRYRQVFSNRRKIYRPPAFVGYLNDYDNFPTVA